MGRAPVLWRLVRGISAILRRFLLLAAVLFFLSILFWLSILFCLSIHVLLLAPGVRVATPWFGLGVYR